MKKTSNDNRRIVWLLTILTMLLCVLFIQHIAIDTLSAYASIFSTAAAFIAVIWFYSGLHLQSVQLKEQGEQFRLEFNKIRLDSKRNALLLAKDILYDMERKVSDSIKDFGKIEDLPQLFLNASSHLKTITESSDPNEVLKAIDNYNKILNPARTMLYAIKQAAIIIFENDGISVISDDSKPEWFYDTYKKQLSERPFFSYYQGIASMLSEFMIRIKLEVVELSFFAASDLVVPNIIKKEIVISKMNDFKAKNNGYIPKIIEIYLNRVQTNK